MGVSSDCEVTMKRGVILLSMLLLQPALATDAVLSPTAYGPVVFGAWLREVEALLVEQVPPPADEDAAACRFVAFKALPTVRFMVEHGVVTRADVEPGVPNSFDIAVGDSIAAVRALVTDSGVDIELRQCKDLNNIVEQDHRAIKKRTRPMMGFKSFRSAVKIIAGIETMHMIRKGQLACPGGLAFSTADYFHSLATE
jgi:hypothetical protein